MLFVARFGLLIGAALAVLPATVGRAQEPSAAPSSIESGDAEDVCKTTFAPSRRPSATWKPVSGGFEASSRLFGPLALVTGAAVAIPFQPSTTDIYQIEAATGIAGTKGAATSDGTGPDIEVVRCDAQTPVRLRQRSFFRSPSKGFSRLSLQLESGKSYLVLVGGGEVGIEMRATMRTAHTERPNLASLPTVKLGEEISGNLGSDSPRQVGGLRRYRLYKVFLGLSRSLVVSVDNGIGIDIEVGEFIDNPLFDYFGRAGGNSGLRSTDPGEVEWLGYLRRTVRDGQRRFPLTITGSRLGTFLVRIRETLPDTVGVNGSADGFTFRLSRPEAMRGDPGLPVREMEINGTSINDRLAFADSFIDQYQGTTWQRTLRPYRLFMFRGIRGRSYQVRLESRAFDAFLEAGSGVSPTIELGPLPAATELLFEPLVYNDDDPSLTGKATSSDSCLFVKAIRSGPVFLRVSPLSPARQGDFRVSVEESGKGCQPIKE